MRGSTVIAWLIVFVRSMGSSYWVAPSVLRETTPRSAGGPGGVTDTVPEERPVALELVAVTEQVYVVPLVSPLTVTGEALAVPDLPPGLQVAVYLMMGLPPVFAGGENVRIASPLPGVPTTFMGAPGVSAGLLNEAVTDT